MVAHAYNTNTLKEGHKREAGMSELPCPIKESQREEDKIKGNKKEDKKNF